MKVLESTLAAYREHDGFISDVTGFLEIQVTRAEVLEWAEDWTHALVEEYITESYSELAKYLPAGVDSIRRWYYTYLHEDTRGATVRLIVREYVAEEHAPLEASDFQDCGKDWEDTP